MIEFAARWSGGTHQRLAENGRGKQNVNPDVGGLQPFVGDYTREKEYILCQDDDERTATRTSETTLTQKETDDERKKKKLTRVRTLKSVPPQTFYTYNTQTLHRVNGGGGGKYSSTTPPTHRYIVATTKPTRRRDDDVETLLRRHRHGSLTRSQ